MAACGSGTRVLGNWPQSARWRSGDAQSDPRLVSALEFGALSLGSPAKSKTALVLSHCPRETKKEKGKNHQKRGLPWFPPKNQRQAHASKPNKNGGCPGFSRKKRRGDGPRSYILSLARDPDTGHLAAGTSEGQVVILEHAGEPAGWVMLGGRLVF